MTSEEIYSTKVVIEWLMAHPLWEHPYYIPMPPSFEEAFIQNDNGTYSLGDDSEWPIEDVKAGGFYEAVELNFVFVNPITNRIDDDGSLNTRFRVWVEAGGWYDQSVEDLPVPSCGWDDNNKWIPEVDCDLNCGGDNVVEAFLNLAKLVRKHYNDDGTSRKNSE